MIDSLFLRHPARCFASIALALVLVAAPFAARAQNTDPAAHASKLDMMFATKALQSGAAEVAAAKLAERNGTGRLGGFPNRMIQDHSAADTELGALLDEEDLMQRAQVEAIPIDAADRQQLAQLQNLHGRAFDSAYVSGQVADHKLAVALFQHEIADGSNAGLKNFAVKTLPILEHHLKMAEQLQSGMQTSKM